MSSFFRALFLAAILSIGLNGCSFQSGTHSLSRVEELLERGELRGATSLADKILKSPYLSAKEKAKIDSILEICHRIPKDFSLSDSTVLQKLLKYNPKADNAELLRLEREHKLDYLTLDGKKRYFKNCVSNVFRLDSGYARLRAQKEGSIPDSLSIFRLSNTAEILKNSVTSGLTVNPVRMKLTYTIRVAADAVPAGETIHCWMPYPRETHKRQKDVHLIATDPIANSISPATDLQRTIYLEKVAVAEQPTIFRTEMEYTSFAQSFRLTPEMIQPYQKASLLFKEYTAERPPQIVFNKRIKLLSKRILGAETNPLLQVRRIYQWINDSVTWASALEYCIMPDIPGFVIQKRHGDCGMQTLLFMSLARSAGIPVKWQSGWMLHPGEVNLHDWCEVWYEGIGWVPLDQSFGLQNSTNETTRDFYMTGIDAYRLIVNDDFSRPLTPSKKYLRSEPYDFQRGEVEWKGGNLYFDKWKWNMEVTYE